MAHPGVVEVDRGAAMWDIALRSQPVEPIQALLVGGYGGAWVGRGRVQTPYAAIPLRTIGATAGVGVIVALGESILRSSPSPPVSPVTWPIRAPVNAVRAGTDYPPSPTIWPAWPTARKQQSHGETRSSSA